MEQDFQERVMGLNLCISTRGHFPTHPNLSGGIFSYHSSEETWSKHQVTEAEDIGVNLRMQWLLTVHRGNMLRFPGQTWNLEHSWSQVTESLDKRAMSPEGNLAQCTLQCHSRDVPLETQP